MSKLASGAPLLVRQSHVQLNTQHQRRQPSKEDRRLSWGAPLQKSRQQRLVEQLAFSSAEIHISRPSLHLPATQSVTRSAGARTWKRNTTQHQRHLPTFSTQAISRTNEGPRNALFPAEMTSLHPLSSTLPRTRTPHRPICRTFLRDQRLGERTDKSLAKGTYKPAPGERKP